MLNRYWRIDFLILMQNETMTFGEQEQYLSVNTRLHQQQKRIKKYAESSPLLVTVNTVRHRGYPQGWAQNVSHQVHGVQLFWGEPAGERLIFEF